MRKSHFRNGQVSSDKVNFAEQVVESQSNTLSADVRRNGAVSQEQNLTSVVRKREKM